MFLFVFTDRIFLLTSPDHWFQISGDYEKGSFINFKLTNITNKKRFVFLPRANTRHFNKLSRKYPFLHLLKCDVFAFYNFRNNNLNFCYPSSFFEESIS